MTLKSCSVVARALASSSLYEESACFLPITVKKLERAKVIWVNRRLETEIRKYFGVGLEADVSELILSRLAYTITSPESASSRLVTDFYGSSGVTFFGGSGRAAIIDGLQVKGVGKTPLVSPYTNWHHSHGSVFLAEAIREVFYAERIQAEIPSSVVPYWAIIDCCEYIDLPNGTREPRALLVRPFVIRPAHVERALGYGHAKGQFKRTFQLSDRRRVSSWVEFATTNLEFDLVEFSEKLGSACANCHVNSWFHGGLFSSLVDLDARVIDFGSTRRVESWLRVNYEPGEPAFGEEIRYGFNILRSIAFSFARYGGMIFDVNQVLDRFNYSYRNAAIMLLAGGASTTTKEDSGIFEVFIDHFNRAQICGSHDLAQTIANQLFDELKCSHPLGSTPPERREDIERSALELVRNLKDGADLQDPIDQLIQSGVGFPASKGS